MSSSLVCLPAVDAGGAGPKAESWAFATDDQGLRILQEAGVFGVRNCKLCDDGIVVHVRLFAAMGPVTAPNASNAMQRLRAFEPGAAPRVCILRSSVLACIIYIYTHTYIYIYTHTHTHTSHYR